MMRYKNNHTERRRGFTLVEAVVAISIVSIAGTAMLMGIASAMSTSYDTMDRTVAAGMAEQLMDEVAGRMYALGNGQYQWPMAASGSEQAAAGRQFNDIDDYNGAGSGIASEPPVDRRGITLGIDDGEGGARHPNFQVASGYFDRWRQEIEVYYVSDTDPSVRLTGGNTSNSRAVEVLILQRADANAYRELASVRRVFSYIPKP
jgi:prepilin-type N-terminal cleavage/methylation domain-containing protein